MRHLISALSLTGGYRFPSFDMIQAVSLTFLLIGSLSGCASQLSVSASDPCGYQREAFSKSRTDFADSMATNVIGGTIGGCIGGLIGGGIFSSGNAAGHNCAVGAAVGAAAGLASAYWQNLQQQTVDQQVLSRTVNRDLATESTNINHIAAAFADLRSCRFAQGAQVRFAVQRGQMSRPEAQQRLAQEGVWFNEELKLAQQAQLSMAKRDEQFTYAVAQLPPPPAPPPAPVVRRRRAAPTRLGETQTAAAPAVSTGTLLQKRNSFDTSVQDAQRQSVAAFSLDMSGSIQREQPYYA